MLQEICHTFELSNKGCLVKKAREYTCTSQHTSHYSYSYSHACKNVPHSQGVPPFRKGEEPEHNNKFDG